MEISQDIRKVINKNRIYSWMLVFIIFVQVLTVLAGLEKSDLEKEPTLSREEFRQQLEQKQQALKELMRKDPQLTANLGLLSLFMVILLITGIVFFVDYIIKKRRDNIEIIPQTLNTPIPRWGLGDVLKVVILFLFFSQFFSLYASILNILMSTKGLSRRAGMVASTGFMDLLILMFVLRLVVVKYSQDIRALGISIKGLLRNVGVALYSYIGFLPILALIFFGIVGVAKVLNYTPPPEPIYELIFQERRLFLLVIISALISVVGPVIEEVFFRGFLYAALRKRFGIFWAISLSAFLFSLLHTNILGFIPILALGIFLAYLREKTGSLIPSITVHVIHNTALASLMFLVRGITSKAM